MNRAKQRAARDPQSSLPPRVAMLAAVSLALVAGQASAEPTSGGSEAKASLPLPTVWAGSRAAKQYASGWQAPQTATAPPPPEAQFAYRPPPQPHALPPPHHSYDAGPVVEEVDDERSVFFDLALTTQAPLFMGGELSLELPGRLLLQGDFGVMPGFYGSAIGGMVRAFGVESTTAALIEGALDGALVARATLGWRPFPSSGFEISAGYTSITLDGEVSPADLAAVVPGDLASEMVNTPADGVTLSSQLHNFHVALGWRWVAFDHLLIRANVGYTQTLASSSSVEVAGNDRAQQLTNEHADEVLDPIYTGYTKLPMVGLSAGVRL